MTFTRRMQMGAWRPKAPATLALRGSGAVVLRSEFCRRISKTACLRRGGRGRSPSGVFMSYGNLERVAPPGRQAPVQKTIKKLRDVLIGGPRRARNATIQSKATSQVPPASLIRFSIARSICQRLDRFWLRLRLLRRWSHLLNELWLSPEGLPSSRLATLMSSSSAGQWMPCPRPMICQDLRSSADPCASRGYQSNGAIIIRPSSNSTERALSVTSTWSALVSRVLTEEVCIPPLQQLIFKFLN